MRAKQNNLHVHGQPIVQNPCNKIPPTSLCYCPPGYCSRYPLLYYLSDLGSWSSSSVAKILQNPVSCGDIITDKAT